MSSLYVGIDGGGSKTTVGVSDGRTLLASHIAGGCNLNSVSPAAAQSALSEAVCGALQRAGAKADAVSCVCAGVAGAGSSEVRAKLSAILSRLLPQSQIEVVGDTVIALEAEFAGGPGAVCIAGTGSIAYGRNARGEVARAGGWGSYLSDEGSGYWIGRQAVIHCLRALDMGRSSRLVTDVMGYWHIATREQLLEHCRPDTAENLAELFPIVLGASEAGDALASGILTSAAAELAQLALVVMRRLWISRSGLELAMTGGVFAHSEQIRQVFINLVRSERPEAQVREGRQQPFMGALYLAQRSGAQTAV